MSRINYDEMHAAGGCSFQAGSREMKTQDDYSLVSADCRANLLSPRTPTGYCSEGRPVRQRSRARTPSLTCLTT